MKTFFKLLSRPQLALLFVVFVATLSLGHQAQAVSCGSFDFATKVGTCVAGLPVGTPTYSSAKKLWSWSCQFGSTIVPCSASDVYCGNGVKDGTDACDGTDLGSAKCTDNALYSGGTMKCSSSCTLDYSSCTLLPPPARNPCGNGSIDAGEQCDGTNFGTSVCSDNPLYDGGTLNCTISCTLDYSACNVKPLCGNNIIQAGEACDGTDLNKQTCVTQGFSRGTLACATNCKSFNTNGCTLDPSCKNGSYEGSEECEYINNVWVFRKGETCANQNCSQQGALQCDNFTCKIVRKTDGTPVGCVGCLPPPKTGCQNPSASLPASNNFNLTPATCGPAAEQVYETEARLRELGLCNTQFKRNLNDIDQSKIAIVNNSNTVDWSCDANPDLECVAYKEAQCDSYLSSTGLCDPDSNPTQFIYSNKARFNNSFNETNACNVGKYSIEQDAATNGLAIDTYCASQGQDIAYNKNWKCVVKNSKNAVISTAYCSAGWSGNAVCGTKNSDFRNMGFIYGANGTKMFGNTGAGSDDLTANNTFWSNAIKPAGKNEAAWICGTDNVSGNGGGGLSYSRPIEARANGSVYDHAIYNFKWSCAWEKAIGVWSADNSGQRLTRRSISNDDCNSYFDPNLVKETLPDDIGVYCGNAIYQSYPGDPVKGEESVPTSKLCFGASVSSGFNYNDVTATWSWTCTHPNGKNKVCSVSAAAACGSRNGKTFADTSALLNGYSADHSLLCATGRLRNFGLSSAFSKTGPRWEWVCENDKNPWLATKCWATTCGLADAKVYSAARFTAKRAGNDFLCQGSEKPTTVDTKNSQGLVSSWAWDCNQTKAAGCFARAILCGTANTGLEVYSSTEFNLNKADKDFLCSAGTASNIRPEGSWWKWDCMGTESDDKESCLATRSLCGTLDGGLISPAGLTTFESAKLRTDDLAAKCSNGWWVDDTSIKYDYDTNGNKIKVSWYCRDKDSIDRRESTICSANVNICGYAQGGTWVEKTMTDASSEVNSNGFLCFYDSLTTVSPVNDKWSWSCPADLGAEAACTANKLTCLTPSNNPIYKDVLATHNPDYAYPLCSYGHDPAANPKDANLASGYSPYSMITREALSGEFYYSPADNGYLWHWVCKDNKSNISSVCIQKCEDCSQQ